MSILLRPHRSTLALRRFFFHEQEDSGKVIDPEERVSEPLEYGHDWMLWGTLVGIENQGCVKGLGLIRQIA
jgi:hypothetical protein